MTKHFKTKIAVEYVMILWQVLLYFWYKATKLYFLAKYKETLSKKNSNGNKTFNLSCDMPWFFDTNQSENYTKIYIPHYVSLYYVSSVACTVDYLPKWAPFSNCCYALYCLPWTHIGLLISADCPIFEKAFCCWDEKTLYLKKVKRSGEHTLLTLKETGFLDPSHSRGDSAPKILETDWRNIKCVVLVDSYDPPESIGTKKSTNIPCMTPQWRHKWRHVKNTKITKNHQNHGFLLFFQAKLHFLAMMCVKVCLHKCSYSKQTK